MARTSVVMITDGAALDFTGSPVKADGYYGFSDGMHTVSFHLNDFRGRIYIEATLVDTEANITSTDWFPIQMQVDQDYIQHPIDAGNLLGDGANGDTTVEAFTFTGNFVYLRAKVIRTYINGPPALGTVGTVDKILLNI